MKSSVRVRMVFSALAVLLVMGILVWVFWRKEDRENSGGIAVAGIGRTAHTVSPDNSAPPPKAREDFSGLPPRERINAETKQRMEETAAWREKLRNGDQTTLPPDAYPPGVPPHGSAPSQ